MGRSLFIMLCCLLLAAGWSLAFGVTQLAAPPGWLWLLPTALLALGVGLLRRRDRWPLTATALVMTSLLGFQVSEQQPLARWLADWEPVYAVEAPLGLVKSLLEVPPSLHRGRFRQPRLLLAPPGWRMQLHACLEAPPGRLLALDGGRLLVSIPAKGQILLLTDADGDGTAERTEIMRAGLQHPFGLALAGGSLYVAEAGRISRFSLDDRSATPETLVAGLPWDEGAGGYALLADGDGLLIGVGASCADCRDEAPLRGALLRLDIASGRGETLAVGLREPLGLWRDPAGALWSSDTARPWLGGEAPGDELNRIEPGGNYGWPACYGDGQPDPSWGTLELCAASRPPALLLPPGARPADLLLSGDSLLLALRGGTSPQLATLPWTVAGPVGEVAPLILAWHPRGQSWWRPEALAQGADGSLFLADGRDHAIYRIIPAATEAKP